ncbi:MAG: copper chaperone PCu(A)C [Pseudomonadales bacterium]|nr:copper chaperone PCu(A)C [Pseudomonadales bacterium]NRA15097.1 copper chaperone PCu(A)C [Oceanospirillaceae bacterium]
MKYFIGFYLTFFFSTFSYAELTITQAHVRAIPPGQKASVAYMTLTNNTAQDVVISGANSPFFMSINLHRTANIDGVMTMRAQPELRIEPNQSVTLAPGGLHWMLMGLKGALKPSAEVPISLIFADGSEQKLHVIVKTIVN